MANYNRVILAGNLTRDPQLSYTPANTPVCKFGMAINRRWTDRQSNERREETCFVDCTAFGRQGETINQYMAKGRPILVEGRLQYSQWTGQDGQSRSKLEVVIENFQFLGGAPGQAQGSAAARSSGAAVRDAGPADDFAAPGPDSDVPF
jgi:single-strand DNA-binding protein